MSPSKALVGAELSDYFGWVAVLSVYGFIHCAHVVGGDLSGECVEGGLDLRPAAPGAPSIAFFAMGGTRQTPPRDVSGRDVTCCGKTRVSLPILSSALVFSPGAPSIAFFAMGGTRRTPLRVFSQSSTDRVPHPSPLKPTSLKAPSSPETPSPPPPDRDVLHPPPHSSRAYHPR